MPAILLKNVSFSYGSQTVLDKVSIHVGNGERAFLIGPNGSGKSTLLKIVSGDLPPDSGRIVSSAADSYIPDPESFDGTIGEFLDATLAPFKQLVARFEQLTAALAAGKTGIESEYDEVLSQMGALDVWSLDARVKTTLNGLGLAELAASNDERDLGSLSPGQRARLKLAAILVVRPKVLILDEPTNHLDAQAIDFLTQTIKHWEGPILATSHDRAFIEDTATAIYDMDITVWAELARADGQEITGIYKNTGNYTDYLAAKAAAQKQHRQLHAMQQEQKRRIREHRHESLKIAQGGVRVETATGIAKKFFTDRAAATSVKRTRNDDVRLKRLEAHEVRKPRNYQLKFPAQDPSLGIGLAVTARQTTVYGRLKPVSFDLDRGEHLLLTGSNGAGKSTLLKWIATGAPPSSTNSDGTITRIEPIGYVPQHLPTEQDPGFNANIWNTGIGAQGKGILHPSLWTTPIAHLSAGNQRRAQLAVALSSHPSLLILDEPTNYLDLDTMQALEEALRNWQGTLIVASHDRWLIKHWHGRHLQLTAWNTAETARS